MLLDDPSGGKRGVRAYCQRSAQPKASTRALLWARAETGRNGCWGRVLCANDARPLTRPIGTVRVGVGMGQRGLRGAARNWVGRHVQARLPRADNLMLGREDDDNNKCDDGHAT